jgi:two-component system, chemotaxis family, protein-glutamate methylesterase/glutaminase
MNNLAHEERSMKNPIRVLSVDDSPAFRKYLADVLGQSSDIDLIGCAHDPYEARDQMRSLSVDVMTIDLDLPRMPGLTFLKLIMERKPMPVIVLSAQTPPGSPKAVEAFIAGAYSVMEKPAPLSNRESFGEKLIQDIKTAASAPLQRLRSGLLHRSDATESIGQTRYSSLTTFDPRQIVALGASTGGTQALEMVLTMLPDNLPGLVVVQHIPAGFSSHFAERLNRACAMEVREAKQGDVVHPGLALIAPGDQHMEVKWIRDHYRVTLHAGPLVEHQRPSVDVLFNSLAKCAGPHTVAALLTGMGRDGAAGMKKLHDLNAHTLVQDAGSSVVYGMARKAVELKAVNSIVSLEDIAGEIVNALQNHNRRTHHKNHVSK